MKQFCRILSVLILVCGLPPKTGIQAQTLGISTVSNASTAKITLPTLRTRSYRLLSTTNLSSWTSISSWEPGTGAQLNHYRPIDDQSKAFYQAQSRDNLPNVIGLDFDAFPTDVVNYFGTELFVATNGNDSTGDGSADKPFRTIAKGVKEAKSGEIVTVRGGEYQEAMDPLDHRGVVIAKTNLTIRSALGATVAMLPVPKALNTNLHNTTGQVVNIGILIKASGTTIDGINVSNFVSGGIVMAEYEPPNTLSNIIIKNLEVQMPGSGDGIACYPNFSTNPVPIPASDGVLIKNVSVRGARIGIQVGEGPGNNWRLENITVDNRNLGGGDSGSDAIAMERGDNFLFLNGEVTGAGADGIDIKADRALIYNAHVHHIGRNGIKIWKRGEINNCLVHDTGADASIVLDHGSRVRMINTVVAYHSVGESAYSLTSGHSHQDTPMVVDLINCVFYRNSAGLYFARSNQVNLQNCLFFGSENGTVLTKQLEGTNTLDVLSSYSVDSISTNGLGSGNLPFSTAPLFINAAARDFGISENSPLRNAGFIPADYPTFDLRLNARVAESMPDLGPFEHQP